VLTSAFTDPFELSEMVRLTFVVGGGKGVRTRYDDTMPVRGPSRMYRRAGGACVLLDRFELIRPGPCIRCCAIVQVMLDGRCSVADAGCRGLSQRWCSQALKAIGFQVNALASAATRGGLYLVLIYIVWRQCWITGSYIQRI
jgi:hypothetical protein